MKSILLLEEDLEGREILSKMLRQKGYRVTTAKNEAAALVALDSGGPADLVLAGTTYRSRLEFLAVLREHWSSMPVVFLADHRDAEPSLSGFSGGFYVSPKLNLYLNTRPIEFSELDRLIRSVPAPEGGVRVADLEVT
jgi:DNA-binding response OmpR family regulator